MGFNFESGSPERASRILCEGKYTMRHLLHFIVFSSVLAAAPAYAQDWAKKMFQTTDHDFGTVARGAKAEFSYVLSNIYVEDVHIANVRASCGCTSVRIEKPSLKTYEKGAIVATLNTQAYQGQRGATLTVTIDKPLYAEVQLTDRGYIRGDVVLEPGSIQLGTVQQGTVAGSRISINEQGNDAWQIVGLQTTNPNIRGSVVERSRGNGQVFYDLVVQLDKQQPAGYVNDHLLLVTNDAQASQIPVPVEGRVVSSVTVSPTALFMGVLQPGQEVTKQIVVQGSRPFRILSVSCDDKSFQVTRTKDSESLKPVHLIPVTFKAGTGSGKVTKAIRITTDLQSTAPEVSAYAVVSGK